MKKFSEWKEGQRPERRFRCSLYVDIWVPESGDLEADRSQAERRMKQISDKVPNSYVGGCAAYNPHNLMKPLDKEI